MACGTMWHRVASLIISEIEQISVVAGMWHHVASHHHIGGVLWHEYGILYSNTREVNIHID